MESQIINLIKTNPSWRDALNDLKIKIKEDGDFAIFNYDFDADFTNPIVREARGIIIDLKRLKVICWPFTKFCNVQEEAAKIDLDNFDWNSCSVQEKIDGSIVKLYWLPISATDKDFGTYFGAWRWATMSCINSYNAMVNHYNKSFGDLIRSSVNYRDIQFDKLKKDCTYIFELVSPETQVVVRYPLTKLYHIGTRNNRTGQEYDIDIGIEKPKVYDIHTLEDCFDFVEKINKASSSVNHEGFVVRDKYFHRIKIKSPEYLMAHKLWNNGYMTKESALKWLKSHNASEIDSGMYGLAAKIKYYDYQMSELKYRVDIFIKYTRALYEEYNHDRKAVANIIKSHKLSAFGFAGIGNDYSTEEILNKINDKMIGNYIPDYKE